MIQINSLFCIIIILLLYIMDYQKTFEKLLKQMNDKKIDDITKKQYWENDIENAINNSSFIKNINKILNTSNNFTDLNNQE